MSRAPLPEASAHSYLGDALEDVHHRVRCEEGETLSIPVIFLENVVLFPTETIPLRVQYSNLASFLQSYQTNSSNREEVPILIGIVGHFRKKNSNGRLSSRWKTANVGTIAEATATKFEDEEAVLMAKGRYRFRLLPGDKEKQGNLRFKHRSLGGVILYDVQLLEGEETYSRNAFSSVPTALSLHPSVTFRNLASSHLVSRGNESSIDETELYATGMNPFPCWVYKKHNLTSLRKEVQFAQHVLQLGLKNQYKNWTEVDMGGLSEAFECPIQFSFREAAQMIVSDNERQELLESSHACRLRRILQHYTTQVVEERNKQQSTTSLSDISSERQWSSIRCENVDNVIACDDGDDDDNNENVGVSADLHSPLVDDQMHTEVRVILCETCNAPLAQEKDVFQVPGAEGTVGAYVNPHGVIHQTLTISQLLCEDVVSLSGSPCSEDTWFPGYSWTISYCSNCYTHLGWKFTLDIDEDNSSLGSCESDTYMDEDSSGECIVDISISDIGMTEAQNDIMETEDHVLQENESSHHSDLENNEYVLANACSAQMHPSEEDSHSVQSNNGDSTECRMFWGVRRSSVKLGRITQEEIHQVRNNTRSNLSESNNLGEDVEVERFLQHYCDNLQISLTPQQLDALRVQIRRLLRENSTT